MTYSICHIAIKSFQRLDGKLSVGWIFNVANDTSCVPPQALIIMIPGPEGGWNLCKKEEEKSKSYFVEMGQLQLYGLRRPCANDPGFKPNLRILPP